MPHFGILTIFSSGDLKGSWTKILFRWCAALGTLLRGREMPTHPSKLGYRDRDLLCLSVRLLYMNIQEPAPLKVYCISHLRCHLITICALCQKAHFSIKERLGVWEKWQKYLLKCCTWTPCKMRMTSSYALISKQNNHQEILKHTFY